MFYVVERLGYLGWPPIVGNVCLLIFVAYLYNRGMIAEFAAVWGAERSPVG